MMRGNWRKPLLLAHITVSVGFIGAVASFFLLATAGLMTNDMATLRAIYTVLPWLTDALIVPFAFAALVVGVALSLVSPWGLVRHYWVIAKEVLAVLTVAVLLIQLPGISSMSEAARLASFEPGMNMPLRYSFVVHAAGGILVLLLATLLSVYKPRGMTPYGLRRSAAAA